jgi:LPXTG-motif cell wall-anchored protein
MKKVKYVLIAILIMLINVGVVNAAATVVLPSSIDLEIGENKEVPITITDLITKLDLATSDPTIFTFPTDAQHPDGINFYDIKTDGADASFTGAIKINTLKVGTATLTITSEDSAEFSSGEEYNFPTKTVTINVVEKKADSGEGGSSGGSSGGSTGGNTSGSSSTSTSDSSAGTSSSTTTTPKNPKTGVEDYAFLIAGIAVIGTVGFIVVKRKSSFNRI